MDHQSAFYLWMVLTSAFGFGYFVYGKKQQHWLALICGVALMVFPYFIENLGWSLLLGVVLIVLPLVVRL